MAGFPEPLNMIPAPLNLNPEPLNLNIKKAPNSGVEEKIDNLVVLVNSLQRKILSLENIILKLQRAQEKQQTKKRRPRSRSRSSTKKITLEMDKLIQQVKGNRYPAMPKTRIKTPK
jgi:hypothetical protein